jgi:hypothetical protein
MSSHSHAGNILFWFMLLTGGVILAPALILPAWVEYQASLDLRARRAEQVARWEAEVTKLRKQREYLENDESYVLRLAYEDLNVNLPGIERIPVPPEEYVDLPEISHTESSAAQEPDELVPELSALVEQVLARYPLARMFLWPQTRPSLLFIGAGLVFTAVALLGEPVRKADPREVDGAGA